MSKSLKADITARVLELAEMKESPASSLWREYVEELLQDLKKDRLEQLLFMFDALIEMKRQEKEVQDVINGIDFAYGC